MIGELQRIAGQCDGVRCDMAMLVLPEVFERTWGQRSAALLAQGHRRGARSTQPDFSFMAEVYWDLEWTLQQQGFDYTYDKRLYDRLHAQQAQPVREHLLAGLDFQDRLARFLENHDEPRAAADFRARRCMPRPRCSPTSRRACASSTRASSKAAACASRRTWCARRTSRWTPRCASFYARLLEVLRHAALRDGLWSLLECAPAWAGNGSAAQFIAWRWQRPGARWLCAAVNYAPQPGQCFVRLPFPRAGGPHAALQGPARPGACTSAPATTCCSAACTWTCRLGPPRLRGAAACRLRRAQAESRHERRSPAPRSSANRRGCAMARRC